VLTQRPKELPLRAALAVVAGKLLERVGSIGGVGGARGPVKLPVDGPPIMATPRIELTNVAMKTFFATLTRVAIFYRDSVRRTLRFLSRGLLFDLLDAHGTKKRVLDGFTKRLGHRGAMEAVNDLVSRSADAVGSSLTVFAQHAQPLGRRDSSRVGGFGGDAPVGAMSTRTPVAIPSDSVVDCGVLKVFRSLNCWS
jgi:hypothetical protein